MSLWLHLFAYDCLGEINISKKFGFMEKGRDVDGMIQAADKIFWMVGLFTQAPALNFLLDILRSVVPADRAEPLLPFTFNEVELRHKSSRSSNDMLGKFLKLHNARQDNLSMRELTAAVFINLMAGHDVLAITLRSIWYFLARDERVMQKLYLEIDSVSTHNSSSRSVPYSEISKLPYLDAVIQETLRIHPNTGTIIERKVPAGGATIDGYYLPEGTTVGVNAWVLHRNKDIYGNDAEVFRPERWLEATSEKRAEMSRCLFTFGAGPHTCIGKNIAMMIVGKVVLAFYQQFSAKLANPKIPWKVHGSWVTKQTEMEMIIQPRKSIIL